MKNEAKETSLSWGKQDEFCAYATTENELSVREMLKLNQCPQRQDALENQLKDMILVAEKLGCYYASHFIKNILKNNI